MGTRGIDCWKDAADSAECVRSTIESTASAGMAPYGAEGIGWILFWTFVIVIMIAVILNWASGLPPSDIHPAEKIIPPPPAPKPVTGMIQREMNDLAGLFNLKDCGPDGFKSSPQDTEARKLLNMWVLKMDERISAAGAAHDAAVEKLVQWSLDAEKLLKRPK